MKLRTIADIYVYEKVLAPSTVNSYLRRADLFDDAIDYQSVTALSKDDILKWRDMLIAKGVRATTINSYIRHCKALWSFALDSEFVTDARVFSLQRLPEIKIKKTISSHTISVAQDSLRYGTLKNSWFWFPLLVLQTETGVRNKQLRSLKYEDVDLENEVLFCSAEGNKCNRANQIPITINVVTHLREYFRLSRSALGRDLSPKEYIFEIARYDTKYKRHSDGMSEFQLLSHYRNLSQAISEQTGEKISGHRLRHSLATRIGSQPNVNIRVVQEYFGWSSIQTAQNYVQVGLSQKRDLIRMLKTA